jgi:hypothetical protein
MTLDERLSNLKAEHAKGRAVLADLQDRRRQIDAQEQQLVLTIARIEGAIQVLSEMVVDCPLPCGTPAKEAHAPAGDASPAPTP